MQKQIVKTNKQTNTTDLKGGGERERDRERICVSECVTECLFEGMCEGAYV